MLSGHQGARELLLEFRTTVNGCSCGGSVWIVCERCRVVFANKRQRETGIFRRDPLERNSIIKFGGLRSGKLCC